MRGVSRGVPPRVRRLPGEDTRRPGRRDGGHGVGPRVRVSVQAVVVWGRRGAESPPEVAAILWRCVESAEGLPPPSLSSFSSSFSPPRLHGAGRGRPPRLVPPPARLRQPRPGPSGPRQPPPQGAALSRRPAAGFPACRRAGNARPQAPGALPGFALSLFCSLPAPLSRGLLVQGCSDGVASIQAAAVSWPRLTDIASMFLK